MWFATASLWLSCDSICIYLYCSNKLLVVLWVVFLERSPLDVFVEGFLSPLIELSVFLLIASFKDVVYMLHYLFRELVHAGITYQTPLDQFILNLTLTTLLIVGIIDLARNILVGYIKPVYSSYHAVGEVFGLLLFYKFIESINAIALQDIVVSIVFMLTGILVRIAVEMRKTNNSLFYIYT